VTTSSRQEWAAAVAAAPIVAVPAKMARKGTWWRWTVTVHGVDATDYCDVGAVKTKREALALVDAVVAEVRASLSDPWNLWTQIDHRPNRGAPCPVVAAVIAADPARAERLLAGAAGVPGGGPTWW
jgi:hypothetical protein